MASSQNVELEAAKFLHKLIQDSKDEPAKLATKLCVILQHMKSSGKEYLMPYQVISRQTDRHSSNSEMTMLRQGVPPRDMARSTIGGSSGVPFKEQQLKQLQAQCLVFLAFRNGLAPKQLHLEIALGTAFSREGKDHTDHKGKSRSSVELGTSSGAMMPFGGLNNMRQPDNNNSSGSPSVGKSLEATSFSKGTESAIMTGDKGILSEERKHLLAVKKVELEKQIQERAGAQASSTTSFQQQDSSSTKGDVDSGNLQYGDHQSWGQTSLLGTKELVSKLVFWKKRPQPVTCFVVMLMS